MASYLEGLQYPQTTNNKVNTPYLGGMDRKKSKDRLIKVKSQQDQISVEELLVRRRN